MNKKYKCIFCSLLLLFNIVIVCATPIKIEINEGWKFKEEKLNNWYPATVPGTVHTDLIQNKIIEDPYFRLNERAVQWVDKEDWIYETTIIIPQEILSKQHLRLTFKGLDTYADVYLNDKKILEADNMFREWKIDIRPFIKEAKNTLRVYFHSPIKKTMEICDTSVIKYKATDASDLSQIGGVFDKKLSPYIRKAGYHFGWDWGPRLVTSGIWRPIILEGWDDAEIEDVYIQQSNVSAKSASVSTTVEVLSDADYTNAKVQLIDEAGHKIVGTSVFSLVKGSNKVQVNFLLKNPKLWWSNGLGEPHLYTFKTRLLLGEKLVDSLSRKTGIRSLRVIRQPDKYGLGFYFELNGIPVFTKGANFIPCDIFLPRVTKSTYKQTILDAVNTHMNMLRVWGGGVYEDDYFYELCDEYGILVWQDFMFACKTYPAEGAFLENIKQEAIDNIRRLRNHACLAMWCGNNEIMEALMHWGQDNKGWLNEYREISPRSADVTWDQYHNLFHIVLPQLVSENDPQAFYLPSSPYTDMQATHDETIGDVHYWTAWSKMLPIATFDQVKGRYFSEYGFQSFPVFESVKKYAPEQRDWDIYSEVMMWHQRGGMTANKRIETCMLQDYGKPKDFESLLYMSQILQGDAMKIAMESHRRHMPFCMGSLYWQINDCWPVASWSSRDYYGRWKAQHYFARKSFDDILVSPTQEGDTLSVYTVSDRLKEAKADLKITVRTLGGKEVYQYTKPITIPANASTKSFSMRTESLLQGQSKADVVITAELSEKNGKSYSNDYFLLKQKDINFPKVAITTSIRSVNGGFELALFADKFARGVFVSLSDEKAAFTDNFFDILPHQTQTITITTTLSREAFEKSIKIKTLSESLVSN